MRFLWALLALFLVLGPAPASALNTALTKIHVQMLNVTSYPGWYFNFGLYDSGLGDCDFTTLPWPTCQSNGYLHADWETPPPPGTTSADPEFYRITAVYWFSGPAIDGAGNPIPGTEDARFVVTDNIAPRYVIGSYETRFVVLRRTIQGENLEFENGLPFPAEGLIVDFTLANNVILGRGSLVFQPPDNVGYFMGENITNTVMFDDFFGMSIFTQTEDSYPRGMIEVPVPEPSLWLQAVAGATALGFLGRKKRVRP